ncbi:MAG: HAMP domain-containing sensor histidine kinase, partial [Candidatus Pacebacteria bacterium]|nr:HAMP domain-containing sensor histidine kinase [Candidatus Paceibacterota bacterium]
LNISRIEMGTFTVSVKNVDIRELLDETVKELTSRFARNIELEKDYGPDLGSVVMDPNILQIVIENLLSNAFKYSPPADTRIWITAKRDGNGLLLSVRDNGIGILPKDRDAVFTRLFRADNAVAMDPDGTGLGLYMVKKIVVDGLGGEVGFDSPTEKGGTGTVFRVRFPGSGIHGKAGTTTLIR